MSTVEINDNGYHTLILTIVHDSDSEDFYQQIKHLIKDKYPLVKFIGLHTNGTKERSKAFKVKSGYSARQNPFAILTDTEGTPIKAFYTEAHECTVDNIEKTLDSFIVYSKTHTNESNNN